ncbi:LysR family transcriptional regulator [Roseobacter sp. EG26]|uniref:LysR family transcriptional regulator n=1 Tax=Roseobacter sp. EG26 TaxID=3412477 RepID=UPI003CE4AB03
MDAPRLSKIDLNLLVVLDVLLREKSVARTADRLNLTSSAVSHALKRLRVLFGNELLVRDGRHMVPTARGESLADSLPSLLTQVEHVLEAPEPFDPAYSNRTFRLAAPDFITSLLPHLLKLISEEAPGVRVELTAFSPTAVLEMGQGRFDALIAPSFKQKDDLRGTPIGAWPWVVYGRKNHPAFSDWSLETWGNFPHLQVSASASSGHSPIDRSAVEKGISRHVGAVITSFSMAAPVLTRTDLLLSVPSIAMDDAAQVYGLERRAVPFDLKPLELTLFRSATTGDQPEIRWFHDHVAAAAKVLVPSL